MAFPLVVALIVASTSPERRAGSQPEWLYGCGFTILHGPGARYPFSVSAVRNRHQAPGWPLSGAAAQTVVQRAMPRVCDALRYLAKDLAIKCVPNPAIANRKRIEAATNG